LQSVLSRVGIQLYIQRQKQFQCVNCCRNAFSKTIDQCFISTLAVCGFRTPHTRRFCVDTNSVSRLSIQNGTACKQYTDCMSLCNIVCDYIWMYHNPSTIMYVCCTTCVSPSLNCPVHPSIAIPQLPIPSLNCPFHSSIAHLIPQLPIPSLNCPFHPSIPHSIPQLPGPSLSIQQARGRAANPCSKDVKQLAIMGL